ncbi:hypothetical protein ACR52_08595, partial [Pseudomonas fildesensis]
MQDSEGAQAVMVCYEDQERVFQEGARYRIFGLSRGIREYALSLTPIASKLSSYRTAQNKTPVCVSKQG